MQKVKLKISQKTGAWCSGAWCSNKGIVLLMALVMISTLVGVIMLCAFVLSHEVDKDGRHQLTRERMLEVKRAIMGRLADTGGGEGITAGGGFISDYGEPDDLAGFNIDNLLSKPAGFTPWAYNDTYNFWAGYRGARYLNPPPGEEVFRDGWGNIMQVRFNGNQIEIESWGSDGVNDVVAPYPTNYDRDIVKAFYWRRNVTVDIHNTSTDPITITVRLIYPFQGVVQATSASSTIVAGAIFQASFNNIPVGLRKIEILKGGSIRRVEMLSLPPGSGTFTMEQIDYSG